MSSKDVIRGSKEVIAGSKDVIPGSKDVIPGLTRDPRSDGSSAVVDCGSSPQ
jgi:hypothetical protein